MHPLPFSHVNSCPVCTRPRQAAGGELKIAGLKQLALATSVDVSKEGVGGAKNFFEAKAQAANSSGMDPEWEKEREERKKAAEEAAERKKAFKEKMASFRK